MFFNDVAADMTQNDNQNELILPNLFSIAK